MFSFKFHLLKALSTNSAIDIYLMNYRYINYGEFPTDGAFMAYSTITDEYVGICFTS